MKSPRLLPGGGVSTVRPSGDADVAAAADEVATAGVELAKGVTDNGVEEAVVVLDPADGSGCSAIGATGLGKDEVRADATGAGEEFAADVPASDSARVTVTVLAAAVTVTVPPHPLGETAVAASEAAGKTPLAVS